MTQPVPPQASLVAQPATQRPGFSPWVGRSSGEGKGSSGLESSPVYSPWGRKKPRTRLSDFHFPFLGS